MAIKFVNNLPAALTVNVGQNTTFSVQASADYTPGGGFRYQWSRAGIPISGATSSSYFLDPNFPDSGNSFSVTASAMNAGGLTSKEDVTTACTLTVKEDVPPYDKRDKWPESGRERQRRLRVLGYI